VYRPAAGAANPLSRGILPAMANPTLELPKTAIPLPMAAIEAFCKKWGVTELALFGSVLRDDFGPGSDVDVMVTFADSAKRYFGDKLDMEDDLAAAFGRPVDVLQRELVERMRNPIRRRSILGTAKVIYAR
jgi:predicted nucleotidyltransferase